MIKNAEQSNQSILMDRLNFSDIAGQMAALKSALFDCKETNENKIEFIKEELLAGRYQINSLHIAELLLPECSDEPVLEPA